MNFRVTRGRDEPEPGGIPLEMAEVPAAQLPAGRAFSVCWCCYSAGQSSWAGSPARHWRSPSSPCSVIVGFIAWAVIIISVMAGTPDRGWLAAALERVDRRLLDRLEHAALPGTPRRRRAHSFVCAAHRPANPCGAGRKSLALTFPGDSHDASACVAFVVRCSASPSPCTSIYSPWSRLLAAQNTKTAEPRAPGEALGSGLAGYQQRRARAILGRSPHHRSGHGPAGDEGGCGAAANRGGGEPGAEERCLVLHDQRGGRDSARPAAALRAALCGLSADHLYGRAAPLGLGCDDLLRQGQHGEVQFVTLRKSISWRCGLSARTS